jgi:hypothetical protein
MATKNTETEVKLDEMSDSDLGLQMAKMHTLMKSNGASDDEIAEALSDWKGLSTDEITERLQTELNKEEDDYEDDDDDDDDEEVEEGKVPPQFLKKKGDKDDDDKEEVEETADMDQAKNTAKTIIDVDDTQTADGKKGTDTPDGKKGKGKVEKPSMKEHIDALFSGEELTEDFRTKATTIFEAAVNERVVSIEQELTAEHNTQLAEQVESITAELTTKVDDYLGYVVEQWMKDNELAISNGLRTEIAEDFMVGLKNLFEESYIDVPDEKHDLIEELASKVSELERSLNDQISNNVELRKDILESTCDGVFSAVSRDLADTEVEKLRSLVEGIEYETEEQYREKINVIKESYFGNNSKKTELFNEAPQQKSTESVPVISDPVMSMYSNAISRTSSPNKQT